jgi:type VI secretion system secreted protein Hcp
MPIYMKYEGIEGDVTAAGHEKWIELNSCQWGVGRSMSNPTGRGAGREASAPSVSEITVTKTLCSGSSGLFEASLVGEGKPVQIDFCKTEKDNLEPYLTLTLSDTMVSGYSQSSGGNAPSESLSLNFTKIEHKHTPMGEDNAPGSPVAKSWNLSQAKPG